MCRFCGQAEGKLYKVCPATKEQIIETLNIEDYISSELSKIYDEKMIEELKHPWWIFLTNMNGYNHIIRGFNSKEDLTNDYADTLLNLLIDEYDIICVYGDNKQQIHDVELTLRIFEGD